MLDLRYVIDHFDDARAGIARRGREAAELLDRVREPAAERKRLIREVEDRKHALKQASKELGRLDRKSPRFEARRAELRESSDAIKRMESEELLAVEGSIREILLRVPNIPEDDIPDGDQETDSREESVWGTAPAFDFEPRAHWDLGPELGIMDFEAAARISGSRFAVMLGQGVRLEMALIRMMLEEHAGRGYTEVIPPYLVTSDSMTGTGQLPKFADDAFRVEGSDLWLVPTAEVPVTNLHAGEILDDDRLPLRYVAFTPCFRSEAGAHGRDVRGLMRQHQFHKVELVRFERPDESAAALESMVEQACLVLEKLELHHRVVTLAAGDMGFSAARCLDIEVWIPSLGAFREISSCSNCHDFQSRRASIRYRPAAKARPRFVHTLNGSALAVGRTVIALLEQHQQPDGSVRIPEALRPYLGADRIAAP